MTEKQDCRTYIKSGELEIVIADNRLTSKQRNAQALELFLKVSKETTITRKNMGIER